MTEETLNGFRDEYAFLSNMAPVTIHFRGFEFGCSESLYQWLKVDTTHPNAHWWMERIRTAEHGKVSKALINNPKCPKIQVPRDQWDDVRIAMMKRALWEKFKDLEMREKLLDTGDTLLVEHNTWNDVFWGQCRFEGRNELGSLLMKLRRYLREASNTH